MYCILLNDNHVLQLKECDKATGMVDGFSSHRDKGVVEGVYINKGESVVYCPIACETSAGSSADDVAKHTTLQTWFNCLNWCYRYRFEV